MLFNVLEFFSVFYGPHIVHLSQLVELAQCESAFPEILHGDGAIVLRQILIGLGFFVPEFCEYHGSIYAPVGVPDAGNTPPGATPAAGGIAPASAPEISAPASSWPMVMSDSNPAGVIPILRRSCPEDVLT